MRCPLNIEKYGTMPHCSGEVCMLYDETCLLRKALQVYVENNTLIKAYNDFIQTQDNTIMEMETHG